MSALKEALDAMPLPAGEPFKGETLLADGWQYRDLPRMTEDALEKLMGIIGSENLRWLTQARYETEQGVAVRGQCLISPAGFANMKAHSAAAKATQQDKEACRG
jgi:hypothetical protein